MNGSCRWNGGPAKPAGWTGQCSYLRGSLVAATGSAGGLQSDHVRWLPCGHDHGRPGRVSWSRTRRSRRIMQRRGGTSTEGSYRKCSAICRRPSRTLVVSVWLEGSGAFRRRSTCRIARKGLHSEALGRFMTVHPAACCSNAFSRRSGKDRDCMSMQTFMHGRFIDRCRLRRARNMIELVACTNDLNGGPGRNWR